MTTNNPSSFSPKRRETKKLESETFEQESPAQEAKKMRLSVINTAPNVCLNTPVGAGSKNFPDQGFSEAAVINYQIQVFTAEETESRLQEERKRENQKREEKLLLKNKQNRKVMLQNKFKLRFKDQMFTDEALSPLKANRLSLPGPRTTGENTNQIKITKAFETKPERTEESEIASPLILTKHRRSSTSLFETQVMRNLCKQVSVISPRFKQGLEEEAKTERLNTVGPVSERAKFTRVKIEKAYTTPKALPKLKIVTKPEKVATHYRSLTVSSPGAIPSKPETPQNTEKARKPLLKTLSTKTLGSASTNESLVKKEQSLVEIPKRNVDNFNRTMSLYSPNGPLSERKLIKSTFSQAKQKLPQEWLENLTMNSPTDVAYKKLWQIGNPVAQTERGSSYLASKNQKGVAKLNIGKVESTGVYPSISGPLKKNK